jgi:hypothetical protein
MTRYEAVDYSGALSKGSTAAIRDISAGYFKGSIRRSVSFMENFTDRYKGS